MLLVAHPDDEVLWFGSVLGSVERVVMVYRDYPKEPHLGPNRALAVPELPYPVTWLEMPEPGTLDYSGWEWPVLTDRGLDINRGLPRPTAQAYERNYDNLLKLLKPLLAPAAIVFTHNPWGEYGHPDHVQIFHVAAALQPELRFELEVSPYYSRITKPMAARYRTQLTGRRESKRIDNRFVNQIADVYKGHNCWTWADDWQWPENESMLTRPHLNRDADRSHDLALSTELVEVPVLSHLV